MPETFWERQRRHLAEDHRVRRGLSELTVRRLRAWSAVRQVTENISAAEPAPAQAAITSAEYRRLAIQWHRLKASVLGLIDTDGYLTAGIRAGWRAALERSLLTDDSDADLKSLRDAVLGRAAGLSPGTWRPPPLVRLTGDISALIRIRQDARAEYQNPSPGDGR